MDPQMDEGSQVAGDIKLMFVALRWISAPFKELL